ncbi:MAG TPA: hypothetical protein P5550_10195 [Bacteroidales bacterium]|nr:hypothetical protein [Bacteroidales bacterium]
MYHYKIFPELRLIMVNLKEATFEEVMDFFHTASLDKEFSRDYQGVVDLRNANMNMRASEARRLARYIIDHQWSTARWALIASTPKDTALSSIYQQEVEAQHPLGYFSTVAAASAYLGLDLSALLD